MDFPAFKIRGHHLGLFAQVASGRYTPEEVAVGKVASYSWLAQDPDVALYAPTDKGYAEDIIGTSAVGASLVQTRITAVLNRFTELEPDDLVTITTTAKDDYCQSCMVGNHCTDRGLELFMNVGERVLQVYEYEVGDLHGVDTFLKLGEKLMKKGKIDPELAIIYRHEDEQVAPSKHALSIFAPRAGLVAPAYITYQVPVTAKAQYVKAVLRHWN